MMELNCVMTAPSITTTSSHDMLVYLGSIIVNATVTPPSGMTEEWDVNNVGHSGGRTSEMAQQLLIGAGATGNRVGTASVSNTSIAQLVALKPAN